MNSKSWSSVFASVPGTPLTNLTHQDIEKRINHMSNSIESVTIGICNGFEEQLFIQNSEFMNTILFMAQIPGHPGHIDISRNERVVALVTDILDILQDLKTSMTTNPEIEDREGKWLSAEPIRRFLLRERSHFKHLVDQVLCDLNNVMHVLEGSRLSNLESDDMIESLRSGHLPGVWESLSRVRAPILQWVQLLRTRLELLNNYLAGPEAPVSYNLTAFQHPRLLLSALLQQKAQSEHLDLNGYSIQSQVCHCSNVRLGLGKSWDLTLQSRDQNVSSSLTDPNL
ncbi:hypothetical protein chiPu_0016713 [Chiloscyllium punctatum]|uniref:Dynein heavy chain C-terminal domain-containing protein n=1 Tax=Chiloscyllium punctatum TaxID=137246 RepID=A0A401T6B2_CHIPU|nr:hypothetical protein [Chiloscyllium punctatum]